MSSFPFVSPPVKPLTVVTRTNGATGRVVARPLKHPLRRMPLHAMDLAVALQPAVDDPGERIQLRPRHGSRPPVSGRDRERHHLRHAVAREIEMPRRFSLSHAFRAGQPNLLIQVHGENPPALPVIRKGKRGRLSRRPRQRYPAAPVADFFTAGLTLLHLQKTAGHRQIANHR